MGSLIRNFSRRFMVLIVVLCIVASRSKLIEAHQGQRLPDSFHVVEATPQVKGLQTIIRFVKLHPAAHAHTKGIVVFTIGFWWRNRQGKRLSPLRSRIRISVRTRYTHVRRVNALPRVVGFLRVLRFPPTWNVDRVGWGSR